MKQYIGNIGAFEYNEKDFILITPAKDQEYLYYQGQEKNGQKIEIPKGILSCRKMFRNCANLELPPVIPEGVTDCNGMFEECVSLKKSPVIPKGVKHCDFMFFNCQDLKEAPELPNSIETAILMFAYCSNLENVPEFPTNMKNCQKMFEYCKKIKNFRFPLETVNSTEIYKGCDQLIWEFLD